VRVLESINQPFVADERLSSIMETYRRILNDCVIIGLAENKISFMSLRSACYPKLKDFETPAAYKNNAISRASGIPSNYRKLLKKGKLARKPCCWKPILTTCYERKDHRILREISEKYGKLQADKAQSKFHKITALIAKHARKQNAGIALEDIKGIRKLYRKENGQGTNYRSRPNSWTFGEFQRQIEYKAKSEGLRVNFVDARNASAKCSTCGNKLIPEESRMLQYRCGLFIDRDENATKNIRKRGSELFSTRLKPIGLQSEAKKRNPVKELKSEVILRVDGSQSKVPALDSQNGAQ
jgi:IS605 OrfB family transposase